MVQELVAETEELKHNQYNKPFEQDLAKWEKKITMAKNSMELWIKLQQDWVVEIEPWFRAADVKTRLPAEYKLFEKMQRIWKRLIRNIKSQPVVSHSNYFKLKIRYSLLFFCVWRDSAYRIGIRFYRSGQFGTI